MPGTTSNKRKASNFKGPGRSLSGKVTQGTKLKKKDASGDAYQQPPPAESSEEDEDDKEAAEDFMEPEDDEDNKYETTDGYGNVVEVKGPNRTTSDYDKIQKSIINDNAWKELDERYVGRFAVIAVAAKANAKIKDQSIIHVDDAPLDPKERYEFIKCKRGLYEWNGGRKYPRIKEKKLVALEKARDEDEPCDCVLCLSHRSWNPKPVVTDELREGRKRYKYGRGQVLGEWPPQKETDVKTEGKEESEDEQ